ncbi:MAG: transposase [Chlamydiia bacterium]|nr:transposase [Chlamydiia bacterium]
MISNKSNNAMIQEILEDFAQTGINQMRKSLENLINQLMLAEREDHIGAAPYERTNNRKAYSNGFKDRKLLTRRKITDIVIDSTGLKVYGEGEWKVRQHGYSKRRTWRKLHLAVCPDSHEIVFAEDFF